MRKTSHDKKPSLRLGTVGFDGKERRNLRQVTQIALSKGRQCVEFLAFFLFDSLVLVFTRRPVLNDRITAIVQLELIGDYFLWLPFGLTLVRHLHRERRRVVMVCNKAWAPLAERYFPDCELIFLERRLFLRSWRYRSAMLRRLRALGVGQVLNPSYPRFSIEDDCVRALGGPATGFAAPYYERPLLDRLYARHAYSRLLRALPGVHQFVRHRAFLEALGIRAVDPFELPATDEPVPLAFDQRSIRYFVLAPGASTRRKRWPAERFVEVARRVLEQRPAWRCVLVGAQSEQELVEGMQRQLGPHSITLAGRTSLPQLVAVIRHASFVLGNESAPGHIAAACGVLSVIVMSGAEYGHGYPYDREQSPVATLPIAVSYPMDCFGCQWRCRYHVRKGACVPCLDAVTVESVWRSVRGLLDSGRH